MKMLYYVPFLLIAAYGEEVSTPAAEGRNGGALTLDFKDAVVSPPDGLWHRLKEGDVLSKTVLRRDDPRLVFKELGGNVSLVAFRDSVGVDAAGVGSEAVLGDGYKDVLQIVWMGDGQGVWYYFPAVEDPMPGRWRRGAVGGKVSEEGRVPLGEKTEAKALAPQALKDATFVFDDSHAIGCDSTYFSYDGKDRPGYWCF